ncbi:hypothetical protein HaLaN_07722 [Haematococcus lacustris]|uniref:Uncharacterized protein n=1 Tax=Haematococcus lacustris TaxID=44745 RepID=A0A699YZA7_HAELA|nr:hypothetical protein HaLaN_07722 [Haematococcus lacustris]
MVSVRPGRYPVRLLPLLSSQHWGGLGTLGSLDLTSLHWAEQGAAAVAAAGCTAAVGQAGDAGVEEAGPGLVVWEQWVPSTGPAAEWASGSLEFPSGPGSWQQAQPHPHLQEGQGQQARHPSGQPAVAAPPLPGFGAGGRAAAVAQRGRPGAGRVTSLQLDWLTQSSEGEGPEQSPGQVLCSQLQAGQLQAPSRQGWWRLAFTCPALPGLGSCYVGPIQVLAGSPQRLQATMVEEGHTTGLARAPAEVARPQVLALAPDTVQVVTPAALSAPPSPTSLALPAVQLAALDAWGNAASLPPGVQLRLVLRCCSPDNSSAAGPAAPGADATAGRQGQDCWEAR